MQKKHLITVTFTMTNILSKLGREGNLLIYKTPAANSM